jgi:hypothetical protein
MYTTKNNKINNAPAFSLFCAFVLGGEFVGAARRL